MCKVFVVPFNAGPPFVADAIGENVDENESTVTGGVNIFASLSPIPENTFEDSSTPEAVNTFESSSWKVSQEKLSFRNNVHNSVVFLFYRQVSSFIAV